MLTPRFAASPPHCLFTSHLRARLCKAIRNTGWVQADWEIECVTESIRKMPHRQAVPHAIIAQRRVVDVPTHFPTLLPQYYLACSFSPIRRFRWLCMAGTDRL